MGWGGLGWVGVGWVVYYYIECGRVVYSEWSDSYSYCQEHTCSLSECKINENKMFTLYLVYILGNYTGHWFNTHTGQEVAATFVTCDNQSLVESIPSFSEDIAVYYAY